jgi:iron complex outermembrane recepter protein
MGGVANTADRTRTSVIRAALRGLPWVLSAALAIAPRTALAQDASSSSGSSSATKLPEIHVIATTPVAPPPRSAPPRESRGAAPVPRAATRAAPAPAAPTPATAEAAPAQPVPGAVEQDKIPSNVQTADAPNFSYTVTPDLLQSMVRALPGVSLGDQTGNEFQKDINYRGFTASPVIGTPQGLAVYQNGVRINEVFGDIVNWDFIPQNAINELTLYPSNPVFGLNAIGGALSFQMKNGFTYHGVEGEVSGGSYGRLNTSVQAGGENGNLSGYFTADAIDDAGWRTDSPSTLRRMYADLGARGDQTEFHLTFTGADNTFGAAAATPVQMLNQSWSSIFTVPQTTENQLAFLTASAAWKPSDTWTFQAISYIRHYSQAHVDGNGTNADNTPGCLTGSPSDPICFDNPNGTTSPLVTTTAQNVPNSGFLGSPNVLGEIDRTWTTTNSFGGSVQAASSEKVFGHDNNVTVGLSVDRGLVQFATTSELGTVNADQFPVVYGSGLFIDQPSSAGVGGNAPVGLGAHTLYTGIYATDTLDLTKRLSLTLGARYNVANISLTDELGNDSELNGNDNFSHFNPMIGATYKITPNLSLYGDYVVANRAPTPLELECSDPARPCLIDNALVGDPPLKQVVTDTYEAGLRGQFDIATGHANWSVGAYHALNTDDIINVLTDQSIQIGRAFFQNAGDTERKGIEADFSYKQDRWNVYANYTYVDATFLNSLLLPSTVNASGQQLVVPGDHLTGIPDYRFKLGGEYQVTNQWLFGADLNVIGSQWLVGDESNQLPKVPAYWVVNLHSSYKISDNVEVFGLVRNLFNQHYYTSGVVFDPTFPSYLNLTDPRSMLPGMPFAAYLGIRGTLPSGLPVFAAERSRPTITKATPASWAPPAAVNWTGVYVGVNGGFTYGGSDWTDSVTGGSSDTFSTLGFVFGGTVGANYQAGPWVVGVEGDGDLAESKGWGTFTTTSSTGLCAGGCITNNSWLATARGRVGYAFDRFLVYGTGGAAFGNIQAHFSNDPVTTSIEAGWTAGAGVEYALGSGWSAKAEYLFVDLGNGSCTTDCAIQNPAALGNPDPNASPLGPPTIPNVTVKFNESVVRAGINYKFGS